MSEPEAEGPALGWIEHALLHEARVPHGFGTRRSPARGDVRRPVQVHGAVVLSADSGSALGEADASVATRPGVAVGVVTADCVPVLVAAGAHAVAAVHAGWRGLARGVIPRALEALAQAAPGVGVVAAIGPSIGPCCYEVDAPVIEAMRERFGAAAEAHARRFSVSATAARLTDLYEDLVLRRDPVRGLAATAGGPPEC